MQVQVTKRYGEDYYKFVTRNKELLERFVENTVNKKTIEEAARELEIDSIKLLKMISYLKRAGYIREVRIR